MRTRLLTPPALEPCSIAEVADHLRLDAAHQEPVPRAPVVALAAGAGAVTAGAHRYRCTFVTALGETDGGDISDAVTVLDPAQAGRVVLSELPTGGALVLARRVYRTPANAPATGPYLRVATIADNTTTTLADTFPDGALGAACPTTNITGDPILARILQAAREQAERLTRRAFLTQTWRLLLDGFPHDGERITTAAGIGLDWRERDWRARDGRGRDRPIRLPFPPLQQVLSIQYVPADSVDGTRVTLPPAAYTVDPDALPGVVAPAYGERWPATRGDRGSVWVDFRCGYGDAPGAVPAAIRQGILLLVADLHERREPTVVGTIVSETAAVRRVLGPFRVVEAV